MCLSKKAKYIPPKFWVSGFQSVNRNGILVLAIGYVTLVSREYESVIFHVWSKGYVTDCVLCFAIFSLGANLTHTMTDGQTSMHIHRIFDFFLV